MTEFPENSESGIGLQNVPELGLVYGMGFSES